MTARDYTSSAADSLYKTSQEPHPPVLPLLSHTEKPIQKKPRRRITFNSSVRVVTIPHVNNFSEEQVQLLWVSQSEHDQCLADCMNLVRRMDERTTHPSFSCSTIASCFPPNDTDFRGLEGLSRSQQCQRRTRRTAAADAILSEQSFQFQEGFDDPELIRQLSVCISAPSMKEARMRAVQDEVEAAFIHSSPKLSLQLRKAFSCDHLSSLLSSQDETENTFVYSSPKMMRRHQPRKSFSCDHLSSLVSSSSSSSPDSSHPLFLRCTHHSFLVQ